MRYLFTLPMSFLLTQCHYAPETEQETPATQAPKSLEAASKPPTLDLATDTAKPAMQRAWYEYDIEAKLPDITSRAGVVIVADTSFKSTDFASIEERLLRGESTISDTTISLHNASWGNRWKGLTLRQQRAKIAREQAFYARQADSLHALTNQGSYRGWLLNNSADTVTLATQDASLVCILQAQDTRKQWRPVQLWRFSGCGNSNVAKYLLPKEHLSFLAKIPRHGNFKTTLRYKLAGAKQFYYSNEFAGYVNYGEFNENLAFHTDASGVKQISSNKFKLDSLSPISHWRNLAFPFRRGSHAVKLLPH